MLEPIQFEAIIESGVIRVPGQYLSETPISVLVTIVPKKDLKIVYAARSMPGEITANDFKAFSVPTKGWSFNREEANERW